ncbi:hypothetical protein BH23ACT5_BH23ACT5_16290 [soil metagenome]
MTNPIVVDFEVSCSPSHAFEVWTEKAAIWWPPSHTVSQDPGVVVVFQPFAGGRIYELTSDGTEHDWGTVVAWEPPDRLSYRWHLFFDPDEATDVSVTFTGSGTITRVTLTHSGFDGLGEPGRQRRDRTEVVWAMMIERYAAAT